MFQVASTTPCNRVASRAYAKRANKMRSMIGLPSYNVRNASAQVQVNKQCGWEMQGEKVVVEGRKRKCAK